MYCTVVFLFYILIYIVQTPLEWEIALKTTFTFVFSILCERTRRKDGGGGAVVRISLWQGV
jgi:hypothetical protein